MELDTSTRPPQRIALALSGGGFRATLFHLGVLRYLRAAGLLSKTCSIVGVSGGSIAAAHLGLNWSSYIADDPTFLVLAKQITDVCAHDLRGRIVRRLHRSPTKLLERYYDDRLFRNAQLKELGGVGKPEIRLAATNLSKNRPCWFQSSGLVLIDDDKWTDRQIPSSDLRLAFAVAASSAFPALFPPRRVSFHELGTSNEQLGAAALYLTDGGVFDNLGARILLQYSPPDDIDAILVSDASHDVDWSMAGAEVRLWRVLKTALRASDIAMDRLHDVELETTLRDRRVCQISIADVTGQSTLPDTVRNLCKSIRTDLDEFSAPEIQALLEHGFCAARNLVPRSWLSEAKGPSASPIALEAGSWPIRINGRQVAALSKEDLRGSSDRSLRIFRLRHDPLSAVNVAILMLILATCIGLLMLTKRRGVPTDLAAQTFFDGAEQAQTYFADNPWAKEIMLRLAELAPPTVSDKQGVLVRTAALPDNSAAFRLVGAFRRGMRVVGYAFRCRSAGDVTWFEPLATRSDGDRNEFVVQVPECDEHDSVIVLATVELDEGLLPSDAATILAWRSEQ